MDLALDKAMILEISAMLIYLLLSGALGLFIAQIYKASHRGLTYSQGIAVTLVLLTIVTTFIVYFIGDSMARAIGLFGVFSIIRYRSAVKDMRDTAFVLFALGVGMAVGVGSIIMASLGAFLIGAMIMAIDYLNLFSIDGADYLLFFTAEGKDLSSDELTKKIKKMTKQLNLLSVTASNNGKAMSFSYSLVLKKKNTVADITKQLEDIKGIKDVKIVSAQKDIQF